jgi:protein-arginine kinase activator protein McsA
MSTAKRKIEELKAKLYDTVEKKSEELVQEMRAEIGRLREEIETLKKSKPNKKPNE